MENRDYKYPEGHFLRMWMGIGIAIFSVIGILLIIFTDNPEFIGVSPAIGVAFGLAIGQTIENKYKQKGKIRPLTESEKRRKKNTVTAAILILALGVFICILLYFI